MSGADMGIGLTRVVALALAQGVALRVLHHLAEGEFGPWSELSFLLPAYACTVGVPLTYYLLRAQARERSLAAALVVVGLGLAGTAAYVGWVNGPVGDLRPASSGSVCLYIVLATLAWFVALPFLRLGLRGSLTPTGYAALFDEAWRLAITLAFATLFVQLFWGLLSLFVGLFDSIHVTWPKDLVWQRSFAYPATCVAASFAIGLTDVTPEMFRALRRLLLTVLRWLTVLAAAIVLLFLATLAVQGIAPLWETRFATSGLIGVSLALITLYNTVYQDGGESERLPRALAWPVRAALVVGPALAGLAFWALALRIGQHGVSEDRLQAVVVVTILAGWLVGYSVVAVAGARAPFAIRHVNVVMALALLATLLAIHSPVVDFKRIAAAAQVRRLAAEGDKFDFRYLRFQVGRHGLRALQALGRSTTERIATLAQRTLAEANQRDSFLARTGAATMDRSRFVSRFEVYPDGSSLPDDLVTKLFDVHREARWQLPCVDEGPPCIALLIDLDGDGREEAVVPLAGEGTVYARKDVGWVKVGRLQPGRLENVEKLRPGLIDKQVHPLPPSTYGGLEIGGERFVFAPCAPGESHCAGSKW